jgi:hypothetical protein
LVVTILPWAASNNYNIAAAAATGTPASSIFAPARPMAAPVAADPAPTVVLVEVLDIVVVVEVGVAVQYPFNPHVSDDLQHSLSQQLPLSGHAPAEQQVSVSGL